MLQATAYQMLGQLDEAKSALQISLFKSLMSIIEAFPMLLSLGETINLKRRFQEL